VSAGSVVHVELYYTSKRNIDLFEPLFDDTFMSARPRYHIYWLTASAATPEASD
jgi:hypothetical protein